MRHHSLAHFVACLPLLALCLSPAAFVSCRPAPAAVTAAPADDAALSSCLRGAFLAEAETVSLTALSGVTEEQLGRVYSRLLATEPELFFVTPAYTVSTLGEGGVPVSLTPTYRYRGNELTAAREDFAARVRAYIGNLPAGAAPLARIADLHDRMILDFAYDEREEVTDPYTLLLGGRGVCQAYALLFTVLCRAAGIPAETVTCFARSHAWNQVAVGDGWYHLDLTWDETELPYPGRVPHTYFLLTDRELAARRALDDPAWEEATWEAPHACDGGSLAGLGLRQSAGRTATLDGETLYFATGGSVCALDCRYLTRRTVYRDPDALPGVSLSALLPRGDEVLCNLARSLLTIRPIVRADGDIGTVAAPDGDTDAPGADTPRRAESAAAGTDASGPAREHLSLSHRLPEGAGIYAGLSLSPAGYPLLTTVAYTG